MMKCSNCHAYTFYQPVSSLVEIRVVLFSDREELICIEMKNCATCCRNGTNNHESLNTNKTYRLGITSNNFSMLNSRQQSCDRYGMRRALYKYCLLVLTENSDKLL